MSSIASLVAAAAIAGCPAPEVPATVLPAYVERMDSADYYIRANAWQDAERCLKDALKIDPANFNNALVLSNLGMVHGYMGHTTQSIDDFTLGLGFSPSNTTLLSNRARAYLSLGDLQKALADLNTILAKDSQHVWARQMRGYISYAQGKEQEALADLEQIDNPEPDVVRVLALCNQNLGRMQKALELYDKLVTDSPTDESYADRALYFLHVDKIPEAAEDVRSGLKINERSGNLFLIRAYINKVLHQNQNSEIDKKMAREYGADLQLFQMLFPDDAMKK